MIKSNPFTSFERSKNNLEENESVPLITTPKSYFV